MDREEFAARLAASAEAARRLAQRRVAEELPPKPWGQAALAASAPSATSMELSASGSLWLDDAFQPSVRSLALSATEIAGHPRLPSRLDRLTMHIANATDREVTALLDGVTDIGALTLRGTPVTDAIIPVIEKYDLHHLDLVDSLGDHGGAGPLPRRASRGQRAPPSASLPTQRRTDSASLLPTLNPYYDT